MQQQQERPPLSTQEFRPARGFARLSYGIWATLLVLLLLGALLPKDDEVAVDRITPLVFGTIVSVLAGLPWLFWRRARIITDESGLRWRRMSGPWQFARWDEITDYYLTGSPEAIAVVHFWGGRELRIGGEWPEREQLKALIAARATQAPVQGWLVRKVASELVTGPQHFTYPENALPKLRRKSSAIIGGPIGFSLLFPMLLWWIGAPLWGALLQALIPIALVAFGVRDRARTMQDLKARLARGERVDADARGLTFWSDGEPQHVAWGALESVERRYLDTASGQQYLVCQLTTGTRAYSFSSALTDYPRLLALLHQHVPELLYARRAPTNRSLKSTEWSDGRRVFHYQTQRCRETLVLCALAPALCLLATGLLFVVWHRAGLPWETLPSWVLGFMAALTLISLLPWAITFGRYGRRQLVLDRESLSDGKRRVFFHEIARVGRDDALFPNYIETHDGTRPIRWGDGLADREALQAELERLL